MKKILTLLTMLTVFTMPVLAHAEENPDMSNLSDEQMMQEFNKRFEGKTNDSVIREPEVDSEPTVIKEETSENFDAVSFTKIVDGMTELRIITLIDSYNSKDKLSEIEKKKLAILEDEYAIYQKDSKSMDSKTVAYVMIGAFFVIISFPFPLHRLG